MATLFISDLHLCASRPAVTALFLDFLRTQAVHADALYILGDLFEYWIGDEAVEQEEFRRIIEGMHTLATAAVPVHVMHGNRDFLMSRRFEKATACRLLEDPTIIDLHGLRVLLMHGDTLCTDDHQYQAFRRMVRDPAWQREFLRKSVQERDSIVRDYRQQSQMAASRKKPEIMDVSQKAVAAEMDKHGVQHLIHGHTHRPGEHVFTLDGKPARRMVLGDWYEQGSVLRCDADDWMLRNMPLPEINKNAAALGSELP